MKKLATIQEVIDQWNYEFQLQDPIEDQETLDVLMDMILFRILTDCEIEEPKIRFYNDKAQVEVIPDEN